MRGERKLLETVETAPVEAGGRPLSLSLFGGFSLRHNGFPVEIRSRKGQILLAYLSLSPGAQLTREHLAGLLWSEFPESHARASLRQLLRGLSKNFAENGAPGLTVTRTEVSLDHTVIDIDVRGVLESLEETVPHPLLLESKRLPETLLAGFDDVDISVRSWLMVQRQSLHERITFALESRLAENGEPQSTTSRQEDKGLAIALLNLDATHEVACRRLMVIYAKEGDSSAALRYYNVLWELLDSEYDMEPSSETQMLVAQIKMGHFEQAESAAFETSQDRPDSGIGGAETPLVPAEGFARGQKLRLVVDPFEFDGIKEDRRYLVSGFRHQLISGLVRFREWSIVDGGVKPPASPVSTEEQVRYRINATSYEAADRIQIVLTLRNQDTGEFVWSEDHSTDLEHWFETQRIIVRRMAMALNVQLSADRIMRIVGQPDVALPVYDRWLKGEVMAKVWRPHIRVQATEIFRAIIDDAPGFAPAFCSLINFANSRHLIFPGEFRTAERESESLALAKRAVAIDPTNSRTHLTAAWSYALGSQFEQAELSYRMAYDLNENDPWTLISSTMGLAFCEQHDEARTRADLALEFNMTVDPRHWGYIGCVRFLDRDYEGCVQAINLSEDVVYNFAGWKAAALGQMERTHEARAEWERFVSLVRSDWRGSRDPEEGVIAEWFLHSFPIRSTDDWARLRDGLIAAGAPVRYAVSRTL